MYVDMYTISQQTKVYQHSYYNSQVAYNKWMKSKDKLDATRNATQRRKKAMEKEAEVRPRLNVVQTLVTYIGPPEPSSVQGTLSFGHEEQE